MKHITATASFKPTGTDQLIHEIATPLVAVGKDGRQEFISGTAFIIGPGWGVTAFHVLEDFAWRYNQVRFNKGNLNTSFQLLALLTLDKGSHHLPLRVLRAWRANPLDLAVLALGVPSDWPEGHRWKVPAIDLLPPKVGTSVFAFGFANPTVARTSDSPYVTVNLMPHTTTGKVIEIHHELRDSSRLPFPCFRTNARFDGGMSGGPVFSNVTGHLCGVICSSLPATKDDEDHISYASTLWPIVVTKIDASPTSVSGSKPYPMMHLFETGVLRAINLDKVGVTKDPEGKFVAYANYDPKDWDNPAPAV